MANQIFNDLLKTSFNFSRGGGGGLQDAMLEWGSNGKESMSLKCEMTLN